MTTTQMEASAPAEEAAPAAGATEEDAGSLFRAEVDARRTARDGTAAAARSEPAAPPAAAADTAEAGPEVSKQETEGADKKAQQQADTKPDPWAGVDPALKRQYDSLVQANRSLAGRLSNQERLLNELRAARGDAPKPKKTMSDDDIAKVRADYPELSGLVDLVEETRQTLQQTASTAEALAEERRQRHDQEQLAHLATRHRDWAEIHRSPEFAAWKAANPRFSEILDTSHDGEELAQVFDLYKLHNGRLTPSPAPAGAAVKPDAGATKRAAQLETSVAISGKAAAAPTGNGSGGPDTASALWRQEVARRAALRSASS